MLWSRSRMGVLASLVIFAVIVAGCGGAPGQPAQSQQPSAAASSATPAQSAVKAEPSPPRKIKVSYSNPSYVFLPVFLGIRQGVFQKHGLDIEFLKMGSGPSVAALKTGDLQYTMTFGTTMAAIMQGAQAKIIGVVGENPNVYVVATRSIPDLATLRKKLEGNAEVRAAVGDVGGTNDISMRQMLEAKGLPKVLIDRIKVVPSKDVGVQSAMLKQGLVELAPLTPPWPFQLRGDGYPILLTPKDAKYGNPSSGLAVDAKHYSEQKAEARALVLGTIESIRLMKSDKVLTTKAMIEWIGDTPETADLSYDAVIDVMSHDLGSSWETLKMTVEARKKQAEVTRNVKMGELFDFELIWQAQKELGLPQRPAGNPPD